MTSHAVILPDGTEIEFTPLPPDDQSAKIFQSVCRHPARVDEMRRVNRYTVSIGLIGPGGSMAAALTMMQAVAAIVPRAEPVCSLTTAPWRMVAATGSR